MTSLRIRPLITALFALSMVLLIVDHALAQSSLGIGRSQQAVRPNGMFSGLLFWIQQQQQSFYKAMVAALNGMKTDPYKVTGLVGLSFAYGIFHAAGPGHGKAVISSYVLANEVAARRGIFLSFASALLQGGTAILLITALVLFLRGTGLRSDNLTGYLEISSYFCVMLLGLYLIWTKLFRKGHHHTHDNKDGHDHHEHGGHDGHHDHSHEHHHHHTHDDGCGCGHSHAPDPKMLEGTFSLKEAWSAILAVGLRPCTGAIIVLTFAFLNGLYLAGILSTIAMSLGTGITVSALALLAVTAKNTAVRVAGLQDRVGFIHRCIEIFGAFLVFGLGLLLFTAALTA
ncbi:MAG: nickel/cobalt transporter [Rhizobiaceae bacterium]|nr:nickel/cobalt transporter [Rhizobiaceae bacterium]